MKEFKTIEELCSEMDNIMATKKYIKLEANIKEINSNQLLVGCVFSNSVTDYEELNFLTHNISKKEEYKKIMKDYLTKFSYV